MQENMKNLNRVSCTVQYKQVLNMTYMIFKGHFGK